MGLSVRGLAVGTAVLWGGMMLLVAVAHEIWCGYGGAFLNGMSSLYPGYDPGGWGSVAVGTLYGLLDGAIAGVVIALVYNCAGGRRTPA